MDNLLGSIKNGMENYKINSAALSRIWCTVLYIPSQRIREGLEMGNDNDLGHEKTHVKSDKIRTVYLRRETIKKGYDKSIINGRY